jgi:hypothetical protein
METKTVRDVIEDLKAEYERHFGVPHSNKAYTEQSKAIKALISAVGSENIIKTFRYLLNCQADWLQNAKNIGGLIKWYDAIQTMRLNTDLAYKHGSLAEKILDTELKAKVKLDAFRKEMLNE